MLPLHDELLASLEAGMNKLSPQARDVIPDIMGAMHGYMGMARDWSQPAGYHRAYLYARLHGRKSRPRVQRFMERTGGAAAGQFRASSEILPEEIEAGFRVLTKRWQDAGLIPFLPGGESRAGENQDQG